MGFRYEPDEEPKRKHHWDRAEPGFVEVRSVLVGKCPSDLTIARAEALLQDGIPWNRPRTPDLGYPDAIYVVYDGAVYRAKPTRPGVSYHAFPELGSRLRELPRQLKTRILEKARELGCDVGVQRWMNK